MAIIITRYLNMLLRDVRVPHPPQPLRQLLRVQPPVPVGVHGAEKGSEAAGLRLGVRGRPGGARGAGHGHGEGHGG